MMIPATGSNSSAAQAMLFLKPSLGLKQPVHAPTGSNGSPGHPRHDQLWLTAVLANASCGW